MRIGMRFALVSAMTAPATSTASSSSPSSCARFTVPSSRMQRSKGSCRSGFTLTELLVVIAIIAVVATLGFFVANRARLSALKVKEMSNVRNISQVIFVYNSDNNILPGPVNRGIRIPGKVTDKDRPNYLSTFLIDRGYLGEDDNMWTTKAANADDDELLTTYVLNSTVNSVPTYFFGRIQGSGDKPKAMTAIRANILLSLGGMVPQDIHRIWMVATADDENYENSPLISQPSTTKSAWGGRFYSFFDGRVEFIQRRPKSIYPSSWGGNHK